MWPTSIEAEEMPGSINLRIGSIILAVFTAEKAEVEREKISSPHTITGIHWRIETCSGAPAGIGGTAVVMMRARTATLSRFRSGSKLSPNQVISAGGAFSLTSANMSHLSMIASRFRPGIDRTHHIAKGQVAWKLC